ncbi:MAG: hypothetical protein GWP08_09420, partial [Nitrospiraceae bacterium]|nr:hypothetical protein [Nitrospiraceae bacterium]
MNAQGALGNTGTLLASGVIVLLFLAVAMREAGAEFRLSFEHEFETSSGQRPSVAADVAFVRGRTDRWSGEFRSGAVLAYPTEGNYDPRQGTIELWVKPRWDAEKMTGSAFFWGVDSDPGKENRTVLGFLGREGKAVVHFGDDGALSGVSARVDWRAGEWHHVAACWDEEQHCRALYIDGERRHASVWGGGMPSEQSVFHVGSMPCKTRWDSAELGHEADAAIDEVRLHTEVVMPGFDVAARQAVEDLKAKRRNARITEAAKPGFESAYARLRREFTLDRVADEQIEVAWEDLVGMAAPISKRVPLQVRYHPDVVFQHPDASIALGRTNASLGLGFALAEPYALPDLYETGKSLHLGYLPIVHSRWESTPLVLEQTAFTFLPDDEETVTGRETQYLVVRIRVTNTATTPQARPLLVLIGGMEGRQNTNYDPFLGSAGSWVGKPLNLELDGRSLLLDGNVLLVYQSDGDEVCRLVSQMRTGADDPDDPEMVMNALRFDWTLAPGETRVIDLVVAPAAGGYRLDERPRMETVDYEAALRRAVAYWEHGLTPGMKLTTPDSRLNDIYRSLILSCLANMTKNPGRPWIEPIQAPMWEAVWPWECMHMAVPFCALGYGRELEPMYRFFTERQTGLGPYGVENRGPDGDVHATYGCYTTNFLLRWMVETGAVLWGMAAKCDYSQDTQWLEANRESILAAWDWIQTARRQTKRFKNNGEKVEYYGLLPKGRAHDWDEWRYHFTFSDAFTWKGMNDMAAAFGRAGLPDAPRLASEAEDYRQCILDVVERIQYVDPETGLLFVPNDVLQRPGDPPGNVWWVDGPNCLFALGLLDAQTDPRFEPMVQYMQRHFGTLMGIIGPMDQYQKPEEKSLYWYVNSGERGLFKNYLARGEVEKALLLFYSTLVYGLSHDCYQTVERIHVWDPNYAPFQPNASGNGRLLDMMKRMVIDEQEPGVLWLLRGCPRRWFAEGQEISVEDAPTLYGKMGLKTSVTGNALT